MAASNAEAHPMLSLSMGRTVSVGPSKIPVQDKNDRALMRIQRVRELEEEQRLEDLEDIRVTDDQLAFLWKPFASVKAEFTDLDGLSWSKPAARRLLARWYKSQVLALRQGDSSRPLPISSSEDTGNHSGQSNSQSDQTIRGPPTNRFPLCPPSVTPPLTLPAGLQEHIEAVAAGDVPITLASHKRTSRRSHLIRRTPPHRVFSLPPRVGLPLVRNATVRPDKRRDSFTSSGAQHPPRVVSHTETSGRHLLPLVREATVRPSRRRVPKPDSCIPLPRPLQKAMPSTFQEDEVECPSMSRSGMTTLCGTTMAELPSTEDDRDLRSISHDLLALNSW